MDTRSYVTKLPDGTELRCEIEDGVFKPTLTTELMLRAAAATGLTDARVLDLGTGCGVVGIAAAKLGLAREPVGLSDLSGRAVALTRRNAAAAGVAVDARIGSLLEPWNGERFDLIIDDVSGVAEDIAPLSPWFDGVPHRTGSSGVELTLEVVRNAPRHLLPGGALLLPVISLSAAATVIEAARLAFADVREMASQRWQLPREMLGHLDHLRRAKAEGRVDFEERFGMVLCYTSVFRCTDPKAA